MALSAEFNGNAGGNDEWFALEDGVFPAVPRPGKTGPVAVRETLLLAVADTEGFRRREDAVKAALLILSQSPSARRLARAAIENGYSLYVDPPVIGGAGERHEPDAQGATDHENRRINLRGADDPLRMALVIAHELAHVSQIVNAGLDISITQTHPAAALRQLLAMEGDARAYEMLVAIELSHAFENDPEERLLFPQMMDIAAETAGSSFAQKIVERVKPMLEKNPGEEGGIAPQKVMSAIFKGFYGSPALRLHYEDTILEGLLRQDEKALQDPAHFQGGFSAAEITARIDAHCAPYLSSAPSGYIDLDGPLMMSVSEKTQARLLELESVRRRNPATRGDPSWRIPAYAVVANENRPAPQKPKTPKP